jgi:hypothetical protein
MKRYGASPVHLLAHLLALALAAWALLHILDLSTAGRVLLWLAGSVIVHDLLLLPLYSAIDRLAERALPGPAVNYVRVPAGLALLLGAVYFGEISGRADAAYQRASGTSFQDPLAHWLLASAALFAIAGAVWAIRQFPGSRS